MTSDAFRTGASEGKNRRSLSAVLARVWSVRYCEKPRRGMLVLASRFHYYGVGRVSSPRRPGPDRSGAYPCSVSQRGRRGFRACYGRGASAPPQTAHRGSAMDPGAEGGFGDAEPPRGVELVLGDRVKQL